MFKPEKSVVLKRNLYILHFHLPTTTHNISRCLLLTLLVKESICDVFLVQESPDEVPDVVQTHVLLQTCREAAVQRLDQQQRFQAVLLAFSQMVSWFRTLGEFIKTQSDVLTLFKLPVRRFAAAFALRQRMLNFVQNIQYYMMFEVMEPTWHIMENNLKTVSE